MKILICKKHGKIKHFKRKECKNSWRCSKCASESVIKHRIAKKEKLINMFGGKCSNCNYNRCIKALEFHHLDKSLKEFTIGHKLDYSLQRLINEAKKCIILCSNCHREEEFKDSI